MNIFRKILFLTGTLAFVFSAIASLEDILSPLPEESVVETVASPLPIEIDHAPHRPMFNSIDKDSVVNSIEHALALRLRPSGELVLEALRELPELKEYSQPFTVSLVSAPPTLSRQNILIRFQVENELGILGEWGIPFRAHVFSDVWRSKMHLRRGELATPSDFEVKQVDLLTRKNTVPANFEVLMGREYSRDVPQGKELSWADLAERSLVRKGELVEVVASRGLLAITMRAIAREDGSEGDVISLRNLDSQRDFSGRVVAVNRIEVVF